MHNIKQEAINAISCLPETTGVEDIMYRRYIIDKIFTGQNDVRNGRTIAAEKVLQEIQAW